MAQQSAEGIEEAGEKNESQSPTRLWISFLRGDKDLNISQPKKKPTSWKEFVESAGIDYEWLCRTYAGSDQKEAPEKEAPEQNANGLEQSPEREQTEEVTPLFPLEETSNSQGATATASGQCDSVPTPVTADRAVNRIQSLSLPTRLCPYCAQVAFASSRQPTLCCMASKYFQWGVDKIE